MKAARGLMVGEANRFAFERHFKQFTTKTRQHTHTHTRRAAVEIRDERQATSEWKVSKIKIKF